MPLFPPSLATPATPAPAALPAHVHATRPEALAGAKASRHGIYAVLAPDEASRQAVLAFLQTPAADAVRARCEVWIPEPADPEARRLRAAQVTEPGVAVLLLGSRGEPVQGVVQGREAEPVARAFRIFAEAGYDLDPRTMTFTLQPGPWAEDPTTGRMRRIAAPQPPSDEALRAWAGPAVDLQAFRAFLQARAQDLAAGAQEPHAGWLRALMASGSGPARAWAATRLVEAGAEVRPGPAFEALQATWAQDLDRALGRPGSGAAAAEPPPGVPGLDEISATAPAWEALRRWLQSPEPPELTPGLYALLARHLEASDRGAALAVLRAAGARHPDLGAWDAPAVWLASDWLVLHGAPEDWDAFEGAAIPAWRTALQSLRSQLAALPAYWDGRKEAGPLLADRLAPASAAEKAAEEAFWAHPTSAFTAWHITRPALEGPHFGTLVRAGGAGSFAAPEAERRRVFGSVTVRLLVDPEGHVRAAALEPGYALGLLAPAALTWTCAGTTYRPSSAEDRGKPWRFFQILHLQPR